MTVESLRHGGWPGLAADPLALAGLAVMIGSEAATLARLEPFYTWNTAICWTGFIVFADAVVYRARGVSWMRTSPREFTALVLLSIPLWLVFELFNRVLDNWHYVGVPGNPWLRLFGYAWAFATIWPAIFEAADLVAVTAGWSARSGPRLAEAPAARAWPAHARPSIAAGAAMLASPFVVPPGVARYLAAPVWLGFIFLLDPINARLGGPSLAADLGGGRLDRPMALALGGLLCGLLWEFWNYWAGAKWHYTVPIMEHVKVFEMPLPGYLGFPPFALECFTMYVFVRQMWRRVRGR